MNSFNKFSELLPYFTCARAIDNLWDICLGLKVLNPVPCFVLYIASDIILKQPLYNLITLSLEFKDF